MPRYVTIPNKMLRDAMRHLGITREELALYMEEGESVLDDAKAVETVLQATGITRSQLEKDCFQAMLHFIQAQKGQLTDPIPQSLAEKWSDPIG